MDYPKIVYRGSGGEAAARAWKHKIIESAKKLPRINSHVIDAVTEMLMTDRGMTKPPEKAAAILALVAEMHERGMAWPTREVIAVAVDCSPFSVDAALSTRTFEGYIKQEMKIEEGTVQARGSVVKKRVIRPSAKLARVVSDAKAGR